MLDRLTESILTVCPIHGVSGPSTGPSEAIRVDYKPEATQGQKDQAQIVLDTFDWSQQAHNLWLAQKNTLVIGQSVACKLENNQSTSGNVYVDCPGLGFAVDAGAYNFTFDGSYTTDGTNTGLGLALNGPAFSSLLYGVEIATSRDNDGIVQWFADLKTGWDAGAPAKASASGRQPWHIFGGVTTTAPGLLIVRFRSEDPGVAVTIQRKSFGQLSPVR